MTMYGAQQQHTNNIPTHKSDLCLLQQTVMEAVLSRESVIAALCCVTYVHKYLRLRVYGLRFTVCSLQFGVHCLVCTDSSYT